MERLSFACTAICQHKIPQARALAASLERVYPGTRLAVLVVDDPLKEMATMGSSSPGTTESNGPPIDLYWPDDIGISDQELHELALCVEGDDLALALVPAMAEALIGQDPDRPVVLLAPDTLVLAPLDGLLEAASQSGVALVPRLIGEVPSDDLRPDLAELALSGGFDPGVVGLAGASGSSFARWWRKAAHSMATFQPTPALSQIRGEIIAPLPGSQPFLDSAIGQFFPAVIADPGYSVAYWNAHERRVTESEPGVWEVSGGPLRVLRLAGFEPWMSHILSQVPGNTPRVLLSAEPALPRLCADYASQLGALGYPQPVSDAWSHLADGTALDERMRRLARRALQMAKRTNDLPPSPFSAESLPAFYDWLVSPDPARVIGPSVPRYLLEIYESRQDLQWNFKRLTTVDALPYRNWVAFHGMEEEVPTAMRPALEKSQWWRSPTGVSAAGVDGLRPGVTLAGYLRAEVGVGEAARLVLDALQGARVEVSPVAIDLPTSRQQHPFPPVPPIADRRINVIWMNAEHLLGFAALAGPSFFDGRYTVGGWAWETEKLPAEMAANADLVDEIWVPSDFVRSAVEPYVDCPVRTFPHPVEEPQIDKSFRLSALGIPQDVFTYLFTFDFHSSFERKNPLGVLEAFTRAFAPGEGPVLILKSVNGTKRPMELERLRANAATRPDVIIVDEYLSAGERGALLAQCGCYVSLHRAEGFGLGMAEAMALGRPVVATGYSGNLEFMDHHTALLVPYTKALVGPHAPPYAPDDYWAEPDLDAAADMMRQVMEAPIEAAQRAGRARTKVLAEHGRARAVRFLTERILEIERLSEAGYTSSVAGALRKRLG